MQAEVAVIVIIEKSTLTIFEYKVVCLVILNPILKN
jgi:hypothetical protein